MLSEFYMISELIRVELDQSLLNNGGYHLVC